jgi:hypothetical protein
LVFKEAFALQMDLDTELFILEGLEISDLNLLETKTDESDAVTYYWSMELHTGVIKFQSRGFTQIVRQIPKHIQGQALDFNERGPVNFGLTPC